MVKFALAGAGKTVGKAIHNYLLEHEGYDYIVLSRTAKDDGRTIAVDYSNIEQMTKVLDEHQIHTVISTVSIAGDEQGKAQLNLIDAAVASKTVQRFIPSEFGARYTKSLVEIMPTYQWKFDAIDRLAACRLEYTLFSNAMFLDYAFSPRVPSVMPEMQFSYIDLDNNMASLPGDGNQYVVTTHCNDIPPFLMKLLDLPKWDTRYFLIGNRLTYNQFVDMAEEVKGVKFERLYNSKEDMEKGQVKVIPAMQKLTEENGVPFETLASSLGLQIMQGGLDLPFDKEGTVINDLFPELKTLQVRDGLKMYFGKD